MKPEELVFMVVCLAVGWVLGLYIGGLILIRIAERR